jgi:hypothetical protein
MHFMIITSGLGYMAQIGRFCVVVEWIIGSGSTIAFLKGRVHFKFDCECYNVIRSSKIDDSLLSLLNKSVYQK